MNADGANQGFDGAAGGGLNLTLRDPVGVRTWTVQTFHAAAYDSSLGILANPPRSSTGAPELTLTGNGTGQTVIAASPAAAITTVLPNTVDAHSYIIRSIVDGGTDAKGAWDTTKIWERMITVGTVNGIRKIVATERVQYGDASWEEPFNKALELFRVSLVNQKAVNAATSGSLPNNTRTVNTLQATANGALNSAATDAVVPFVGMRILVKDEATQANNGIYRLTQIGTAGTPWIMVRDGDADTSTEFNNGMLFPVTAGTLYGGSQFVLGVPGSFVLNTGAVSYTIYAKSGIYDVKVFGAVGNGSANDTTAIANAIAAAIAAGGGIVLFPPGTYSTSNIAVTSATGVTLRGAGHKASIIKARQTGVIVNFSGCTGCGFEYLAIERGDSLFQTSGGYSLKFGGGSSYCWTNSIRVSYCSGGILIERAYHTHLKGRTIVDHLSAGGGSGALRFSGEATAGNAYDLTVDWLVYDWTLGSQRSTNYSGAIVVKTWTISTAFSVGDVVFTNDGYYECTTAGASAGSGTGPSGIPGTDGPSAYTTGITDGSVTWKFLVKNCFAVNHDYNANYLQIRRFECLGACSNGIQMWRSDSGENAPTGLYVDLAHIEASIASAVFLDRGSKVRIVPSILRIWNGYGIIVAANFGGEVEVAGGIVKNAAKNGLAFDSGGVVVDGTQVLDSSQLGVDSYAGILISASVANVSLNDVVCTGTTFQANALSIGAGATNYAINGGRMSSHGMTVISDSANSATGKIRNVVGYDGDCGRYRATAQTAAISAQNLFAVAPAAGMYHVDVYLEINTAGTAGTIDITVSWTDSIGATSYTTSAAPERTTITAQNRGRLTLPIRTASGQITVATVFNGVTVGALQYSVTGVARRADLP